MGEWANCPALDPSNLYGNVNDGQGWRVQNFGYRQWGCLGVGDRSHGNHARGWAQSIGGATATFLGVSEEFACAKDTSPVPVVHLWHCISPNGFNQGRSDFVNEVVADAYYYTVVSGKYEHNVPVRAPYTTDPLGVGTGLGTDSTTFDSIDVLLTLKKGGPGNA